MIFKAGRVNGSCNKESGAIWYPTSLNCLHNCLAGSFLTTSTFIQNTSIIFHCWYPPPRRFDTLIRIYKCNKGAHIKRWIAAQRMVEASPPLVFFWFAKSHSISDTDKKWKSESHSVASESLWPCGLQPGRLLWPQNSPGESTKVDCHFLLQRIFPIQGLNPGLPPCKQNLYHLSPQGRPWHCQEKAIYPLSIHNVKTNPTSLSLLDLGNIFLIYKFYLSPYVGVV